MDTILLVSSWLLWVIVLINFFLTLALIRRINMKPGDHLESFETLEIGQKAPDFVGESLTGEQVKLADYAGRALAHPRSRFRL